MFDRERFWTLPRVLSLEIAIAQVVVAAYLDGTPAAIWTTGFFLIPLACIWFSREMGDYRGIGLCWHHPITQPTPASVVCVLGWVLLILPAVVKLALWLL